MIKVPFQTIRQIFYHPEDCRFSQTPRRGDLVTISGWNPNSLTRDLDLKRQYRVLSVEHVWANRILTVSLQIGWQFVLGERCDVLEMQVENRDDRMDFS